LANFFPFDKDRVVVKFATSQSVVEEVVGVITTLIGTILL
jgi:hypothetical protein